MVDKKSNKERFIALKNDTTLTFGQFLEAIREPVISRNRWASDIGFSRGAVEAYERKGRLPDIDYLAELSAVTGYDLMDLIARRIMEGKATPETKAKASTVFLSYNSSEEKVDYERIGNQFNNEISETNFLYNHTKMVSKVTIKKCLFYSDNNCSIEIDTSDTSISKGTFAFGSIEEPMIKVIKPRLDGSYIVSDEAEEEMYTQEQLENVPIIGRVVSVQIKRD